MTGNWPDMTGYEPGEDGLLLYAECVHCGTPTVGDPERIPSVLCHEATRCPLNPDGSQVRAGQPGVHREPLCRGCVSYLSANIGKPTRWPLSRMDIGRP
jgi:hypothetical protein